MTMMSMSAEKPAKGPTPRSVAAEISERIGVLRADLVRRLMLHDLRMEAPEGLKLSPALLKRIAGFNKGQDVATRTLRETDDSLIELPLDMANPEIFAADIARRAGLLRAARYDALRAILRLLADRRELTADLSAPVSKRLEEVETELADARAKAAKGLDDAGLGMAPFVKQHAPAAAAILEGRQVEACDGVGQLAGERMHLVKLRTRLADETRGARRDAQVYGEELVKVFKAIAGPLAF